MKHRAVWKGLALGLAVGILCAGCSKKMGVSEDSDSQIKMGATTFYTPPKEDIVKDPDTGLEVVKNVLTITFSKKMDETAIQKVVSSINGEIVGRDKAARFYQVRIKTADLADIDKLAKELLVRDGIELVARNSVSVHVDPYYVR
jgi:hypothetical protein